MKRKKPRIERVWGKHLRTLRITKVKDRFTKWSGDESLADLANMTQADIVSRFSKGTGSTSDWETKVQCDSLISEYPRYANIQHLAQSAIDGDWDEFQDGVYFVHQLIPDAFNIFYQFMPEEYRREFVLRTYRNGGDEVEACREAVRSLPREGANELPDDLRGQDVITVYRAGLEDIDEAPRRLSWTTSLDVASFFYMRHDGGHVYRASLRTQDVISYSDARDEQEALQYCGVYDVEEIEADTEAGEALAARFNDEEIKQPAKEMQGNEQ